MARSLKRIKVRITIDAYIDRDEWAAEYSVHPDNAADDVKSWFEALGAGVTADTGGFIKLTDVAWGFGLPLPGLSTITKAQAKIEGYEKR